MYRVDLQWQCAAIVLVSVSALGVAMVLLVVLKLWVLSYCQSVTQVMACETSELFNLATNVLLFMVATSSPIVLFILSYFLPLKGIDLTVLPVLLAEAFSRLRS